MAYGHTFVYIFYSLDMIGVTGLDQMVVSFLSHLSQLYRFLNMSVPMVQLHTIAVALV
jgi:hypothetical protein